MTKYQNNYKFLMLKFKKVMMMFLVLSLIVSMVPDVSYSTTLTAGQKYVNTLGLGVKWLDYGRKYVEYGIYESDEFEGIYELRMYDKSGNEKMVYLNGSGEAITKPITKKISRFEDRKKGEKFIPPTLDKSAYDEIGEFKNGKATIYKKENQQRKCGIVDKEGKILLPLEYDGLFNAHEDVVLANKGEKTYEINLITGEQQEKEYKAHYLDEENRLHVGIEKGDLSLYAIFDKYGKTKLTDYKEYEIRTLTGSYGIAYKSGYDPKTMPTVPPHDYGRKMAITDEKGNRVTEFKYASVSDHAGGGFLNISDNFFFEYQGLANRYGVELLPMKFKSIFATKEGYIYVAISDDYDGNSNYGRVGIFKIPQYFYDSKGVAPISVYIDNRELYFDVPPIIQEGRTLVPMRKIFEVMGAKVDWDNDARTVNVVMNEKNLSITIDSKRAKVNGADLEMDVPATILNSRTLVPLRFVSENLGAKVDWDNDARRVLIRTDVKPEKPTEGVTKTDGSTGSTGEMHAMWISFIEFMSMPKDEQGFKKEISKMYDRSKELGMNSVIVHVRSHSDAMYPSKYYPWAIFPTGVQGKNPGYDPLKYMVEEAHKRGLEFHAWVNPYRITGYGTYWNQVGAQNLAKVWQEDGNASNDRWAIKHKGEYYLNPSVPEVKDLVIKGVKEIVENYDVDGIHFDDYFYPSVNDQDPALWFDKPEYDKGHITPGFNDIARWRRENVDSLLKGVYDVVKASKPNVVFGVSPAGNLSNLRSNTNHFVNIDKWFSQKGYVDYVMPQLYWGFDAKLRDGSPAPYAYERNLNSWMALANTGSTKLYVGLNMANGGKDVPDNNPTSEWILNNDVISKQVKYGRQTGKIGGYAYFRYEFFNKNQTRQEVENLSNTIKIR